MTTKGKVICGFVYGVMIAILAGGLIVSVRAYKAHGADLNSTINIPATIQGYNTLDVLNWAATQYGKTLTGGTTTSVASKTVDQLRAEYDSSHTFPLFTDKQFNGLVGVAKTNAFIAAIKRYKDAEQAYVTVNMLR